MPGIHRGKYYRRTVLFRSIAYCYWEKGGALLCKMVLRGFFSEYFEHFIRGVIIKIKSISCDVCNTTDEDDHTNDRNRLSL